MSGEERERGRGEVKREWMVGEERIGERGDERVGMVRVRTFQAL